jgi:hypothetical protein
LTKPNVSPKAPLKIMVVIVYYGITLFSIRWGNLKNDERKERVRDNFKTLLKKHNMP